MGLSTPPVDLIDSITARPRRFSKPKSVFIFKFATYPEGLRRGRRPAHSDIICLNHKRWAYIPMYIVGIYQYYNVLRNIVLVEICLIHFSCRLREIFFLSFITYVRRHYNIDYNIFIFYKDSRCQMVYAHRHKTICV